MKVIALGIISALMIILLTIHAPCMAIDYLSSRLSRYQRLE